MEVQQPTFPLNNTGTSHIKSKLQITPQEYMQDRVIYKMDVYGKLGRKQKRLYQVTSFLGIVISASVPVLINLNVILIVPTLLSLAVTILVAAEKLFHFREHWRNYDSCASFLRSEQLLFQTKAGIYERKENDENEAGVYKRKENDENDAGVYKREENEENDAGVYERKENDENAAFQLFVRRVEDVIKEERTDTIEMRTSESAGK